VVVGLVLAVAYHYLSMRLQRWVTQKKSLMQPVMTILGFLVRLAVFVGILLALGFWSPLNILAVCLSFVVVFTILNGIWLYSLARKTRGVPPSANAGGAN
jgi:ABC-type transport system involved in Fe-S cluster assembly fused permease/ATPase subunit